MPASPKTVAERLADIRSRIESACERSDRHPSDVRLVAVTKYAPLELVHAVVDLGVCDLGESRPQQLLERADLLHEQRPEALSWHQIGHLQRNKVRKVLPAVTLTHSVDTLKLAEAIDRIAGEDGLTPRILLEVNIAGDEAKDGFAPQTLREQWSRLTALPRLEIAGLMTMAPHSADPEAARPVFAGLRELRDELRGLSEDGPTLKTLSMGMSGDFEIAIEEGATIIRPGSGLFG
ncbi:YggS family pyridoxal phosphate-dependent enzyme [Stratiformator vulcanicus]|uniref:Pyridoxal phosphate homeostasis protein n=1 Tax=Stratiformator vulcanicus TaxID=2527980 RepID=A0A517R7P8_9PLAN|nr:YggS family pyridoxal phosphate-dependent enzyme [Stratiformator vulcanicus]QDT39917.1 Pyridoxal phosphate homeostasis protein [Stratiformator vulcanicus]